PRRGGAAPPPSGLLRIDRAVSPGADQRADVIRPRHSSEPLIEDVGGNPPCYLERCIRNLARRRIDQAERDISLGYLLRDRLSRYDEHLLRHPGSLGGN